MGAGLVNCCQRRSRVAGRRVGSVLGLILTALAFPIVTAPVRAQTTTLRVGHFPNVTHVQALVARNFERQGREWFVARLGSGVKIEWYAYNAGPSAMEAIFANSLDLTYVGPNPAINAYARSRGERAFGLLRAP